jgi:hypothetical protein
MTFSATETMDIAYHLDHNVVYSKKLEVEIWGLVISPILSGEHILRIDIYKVYWAVFAF